MNLKDFQLHHETDTHYTLKHPSGKMFTVDKKGLHEKAHKEIGALKMADGGEVPQSSTNYDPNGPENNFGAGMEPAMPPPVQAAAQPQAPVQPEQTDGIINPHKGEGGIAESLGETEKALETQKALNVGQAGLAAQQAEQENKAISGIQNKIDQMPTQQDIVNQYKSKDQSLMDAYVNKKLDPERYYKNMSTGARIASSLGMILSGFGSALSGQPNMAANIMQKAVDDDIEAQKVDQSKAMNLWKMNKDALGNDLAANLATQNQMYTGLKFKLEQAASRFKGPQAALQAQQLNTALDQKIAENHYKLALMNPTGGNGGLSNMDPAMAVPMLVPADRQKEALAEIKRAQDVKAVKSKILEAFDNAAKDVRVMSGGRIKNALPFTESAYSKELEGLLLTTVQDLEGSVKQTAMETAKNNYSPQKYTNDKDIQIQRKALNEYLDSKQSSPTAKSYGIDLTKYKSTAPEHDAQKVERVTKDGRTAIFDANTKQFLGYK